jgi:hypothetical protein
MPFEYFVRPFQTPDSNGRVIIPSTPSGHERATLTWGAKTSSLPAPERTGTNVNCCGEELDEGERDGEVHKISSVESPGLFVLEHRPTQVKLRKKHEDKCAADWNQMSGVASAVESAFSSLEADIEAQGAGADVDHCKTQVLHLNPG